MSYYLEQSTLGYDTRFSIGNALPVDMSIKEHVTVNHRPISPIKRGQCIEFAIQPMNLYYTQLNRTRLRISVKLYDAETKEPIVQTDETALLNYPLNAMFRSVDFSINQKELSADVGANYPYKAYFDLLTQAETTQVHSSLQAAGVYMDAAGAMDQINEGQTGFKIRELLTKGGSEAVFEGYLHCDFLNVKQFLPNGLSYRFKFYPANDEFCLFNKEGKFYYEILDASITMSYINPSSQVILAHDKMLESSPALFSYARSNLKTFVIPNGLSSWQIDGLFADSCPYELLIGIVSSKAYSGSADSNPFNFKHHKLNYLEFSVEGHSSRGELFTPDFTDGSRKFTKEFLSLYDESNNNSGIVDINKYNQGYTIYRIKLASGVTESHTSMGMKAQTRLSLRFNENLTEACTLIAYGKFNCTLQLDQSRNIYLI